MAQQVILQDLQGSRWLQFTSPRSIIAATRIEEVLPKLSQIEKIVDEEGLYAAGFITYEAAPAFDEALQVKQPTSMPLLWFGLFDRPLEIDSPFGEANYRLSDWQPSVNWHEYKQAILKVKNCIEAGITYQVNYTYRLRADFTGSSWGLFLDLIRAQESDYAAYIDTGSFAICSASPELFFELNGTELSARPMKGTANRGRTQSEDLWMADWLHHSDKNRAENVMIVDMIRNDIGRVCTTGSVTVPKLFSVERYPTLWQMTSSVFGHTEQSVTDIMSALFPCASITGAPKVSTMRIIAGLESAPRGIYSGCIGFIAPGRRAQFNVAIRTVTVDKANNRAEYGVGGGIVWDSETENEYEECQTKAQILFENRPVFRLLESLLWTPGGGFYLLEEHLARMADSAAYFGFNLDLESLKSILAAFSHSLTLESKKVRMLLSPDGAVELESSALGSYESPTVGLSKEPIKSNDVFLFHKTTRREVYEQALANCPEYDDVLLWNERGEITEACSANVVVKLNGTLLTPPVDSGLLPGTYRGRLLAKGKITERIITLDDLQQCEAIYLINSVRKWREARLVNMEMRMAHV